MDIYIRVLAAFCTILYSIMDKTGILYYLLWIKAEKSSLFILIRRYGYKNIFVISTYLFNSTVDGRGRRAEYGLHRDEE